MADVDTRILRHVNLPGLLTIAALLGLWETVVRAGIVVYDYLPAPSAIAREAVGLVASGELASNIGHTLTATLAGWVGAIVIGVSLGLLLGLSPTARRYSMSSIEATKAVPPITLVPVALLVFGFSLRMELVIVVYVGVWPVLINTIGGVQSARDELLDVGRMLRMSRITTITKIILPAALPAILVGLRLALSLCLVLAVVAEMVGNPSGLGNAIVRARQALQPAQMFTYVLATGVVGIALNAAVRTLSARILPPLPTGRGRDAP